MSDNLVIDKPWQDVLPRLVDVAMIYADPPYGTGRTFSTYSDTLSLDEWRSEIHDLADAAKAALSRSGVFWLHLDDVRAHHGRVIGDEVFGPNNHIGTIAWQRNTAGRSGTSRLVRQVDYIIGWRRSAAFRLRKIPKTSYSDSLYGSRDGDTHPWRRDNLSAPGFSEVNCHYGITNPLTGKVHWPPTGSHWRWEVTRCLEALRGWGPYEVTATPEGTVLAYAGTIEQARAVQSGVWPIVYFGTTGLHAPQRKSYHRDDATPSNFWPADLTGTTSDAARQLKAAIGRPAAFDTPKPEGLMERLVAISTDPSDVVVDPYAGSGTTGLAAARLGRSFVMCEVERVTVDDIIIPRLNHHAVAFSTTMRESNPTP